MCPHKNVYIDMHSSTIYNSPEVETVQMSSSDKWLNKMWYSHSITYYLAIRRNEVGQVQWLTSLIPALWEGGQITRGQEFEISLANMAKPRLY